MGPLIIMSTPKIFYHKRQGQVKDVTGMMGSYQSKLYSIFETSSAETPARILMLGLHAAGKTSILNKVKLNENVYHICIPTSGFNAEKVEPVKGVTFTVLDVGEQEKIRPMWRYYYQNTEGLIYVVDSSNRERVAESREELFGILDSAEMSGVPVVVIANKQDLPNSLKPSEDFA